MIIDDLNYVSSISHKLKLFEVKNRSPYRANFRCPLCGDSKKSQYKKRGWLLEYKGTLFYKCHNECVSGMPFSAFLKRVDPAEYDRYLVETKLQKIKHEEPKPDKKKKIVLQDYKSTLSKLKKISSLKLDHPARKYLDDRLIPANQHYRIFYSTDFNKFVNSIIPGKLPDKIKEPRLVLPFFDQEGRLFGFAGRGFKKKGLRYISIMLDDNQNKFFGLEQVDFSKPYIYLEGPIDSLFLTNSLAAAGADAKVDELPNKGNMTAVLDNEPYNKEICRKLLTLAKNNYKVCIWPKEVPVGSDINDLILAGWTQSKIYKVIEDNTYKGLMAELKLAEWMRV